MARATTCMCIYMRLIYAYVHVYVYINMHACTCARALHIVTANEVNIDCDVPAVTRPSPPVPFFVRLPAWHGPVGLRWCSRAPR